MEKKLIIDFSKFKNGKFLEKVFNESLNSLMQTNILMKSDFPSVELMLVMFDDLFSRIDEIKKYNNISRNKFYENKILFYTNKKKMLNSLNLENETNIIKVESEILECDLKIKNLNEAKKFKILNISENGELLLSANNNIVNFSKELLGIVNSLSFSPNVRIRLQNMVGSVNTGLSLKDAIKEIMENDERKFKDMRKS